MSYFLCFRRLIARVLWLMHSQCSGLADSFSSILELRIDGIDEVNVISRLPSRNKSVVDAPSLNALQPCSISTLDAEDNPTPSSGRKRVCSRDMAEMDRKDSPIVSEEENRDRGSKERRRSLRGYASGGAPKSRSISSLLAHVSSGSLRTPSYKTYYAPMCKKLSEAWWASHSVIFYVILVSLVLICDPEFCRLIFSLNEKFWPLSPINFSACLSAFSGSMVAWIVWNWSMIVEDAMMKVTSFDLY